MLTICLIVALCSRRYCWTTTTSCWSLIVQNISQKLNTQLQSCSGLQWIKVVFSRSEKIYTPLDAIWLKWQKISMTKGGWYCARGEQWKSTTIKKFIVSTAQERISFTRAMFLRKKILFTIGNASGASTFFKNCDVRKWDKWYSFIFHFVLSCT